MMDQDKVKKVIEAAKMYYFMDFSQQEIAEKLGVSRPTVSRFLQQAKEEGFVQIKIMDPSEDNQKLAYQLKQKFGLKKVIVASVPHYDEKLIKDYVAEEAAIYLDDIVKAQDTIALTWGTTLYQIAGKVKHKHVDDVKVVQLKGGVSHSEANTYMSEILYLFGKAYGSFPHFLPLPAIVDHMVVKQAMESDRHIRKVLEMGKEANIAVFTVGVPTPDSVFLQMGYFTEAELKIIYEQAVGDICSRFFDRQGRICLPDVNARTIGIDLNDLKAKEHSILVAGGSRKVEAIYGALKGEYANVLITDQFTAKSLLDKKDATHQPDTKSATFSLSESPLF